MPKKTSLAIIYGGRSGEHEVSVMSATSVAAALDPSAYDIVPVKIGKDGVWSIDGSILPGGRRSARKARDRRFFLAEPGARTLFTPDGRPAERIDAVFPLVHGTYGEDGCLQGLFELAEIPYVGSGVLGSAVGMDKVVQKQVLRNIGLPVTDFLHFTAAEWASRGDDLSRAVAKKLGYPCFVKPANLGSSVGITKAHHERELRSGVKLALEYDTKVVVEAAVPKAREIECSVLGNDHPKASVLGEIVPSNEFYDYDAKYVDGNSKIVIEARLPEMLSKRIRDFAVRAFKALNASGMARVDFLLASRSGDVVVNEINTIPGFTSISMYPKLWEASGLPYGRLLDEVIALAIANAAAKRKLSRDYAPKGRTKTRRP